MAETMCCPLSGNDGDNQASVYRKSHPRAQKDHTCSECGTAIRKGERYEHVKGLWDGEWSTFRTCSLCVEIRDHFACDGFIFQTLWEDLENNFFPDMKAGGPCMEGLSPAAKQALIDARMEWYFEQDECNDSQWDGWTPDKPPSPPRPVPEPPVDSGERVFGDDRRWD